MFSRKYGEKMHPNRKPLPKTLFLFIWHFLREHKRPVTVCIFLAITAGFWGPFNNMLLKYLINLLPVAADTTTILWVPAGLIALNFILFDNVTWRGINYIWAKYVPIIQNKIIATMLDYALSQAHGFYENNLSGKIAKHITNLVDGITRIITFASANLIRGLSLIITAFIVAYSAHPIFCLILMCWFTCFASVCFFTSKRLMYFSDALAAEESVVVGELVDSLSNHNNVRIFSRRMYENTRMFPFFQKQQEAYTKNHLQLTWVGCIEGGLIAIMMAFSGFFLVHLYGKGLITAGDFALVLGLSMETGHMMWFTMSEVDKLNAEVGRCKQSLKALMVPLEITDTPTATALNCTHGHITFDNVTFHYKGTKALFQNKSININAGQKVGLVGYSGGGKSTFVNLILRLYDVTNGTILIDGQDIRDVTQDSLRKNIAMIPQDPSLFHRSLMENIRYGRIDASDEEVIDAAKKAHAHEFISTLPQGYDALVGERGVKLSGGQRQRIAIARAILKNAPILILDEATSQLDSVTEHLIQESLWTLMNQGHAISGRGKTTIVIAHRLSTLLHMDRILVFDKGTIIEDGTHSELITKVGLYKRLWDAQVGGFLGDTKTENE